jgi:hypothetical protein
MNKFPKVWLSEERSEAIRQCLPLPLELVLLVEEKVKDLETLDNYNYHVWERGRNFYEDARMQIHLEVLTMNVQEMKDRFILSVIRNPVGKWPKDCFHFWEGAAWEEYYENMLGSDGCLPLGLYEYTILFPSK